MNIIYEYYLELDNILLGEKSNKIFLIYYVGYKNRYGAKTLSIIFDKVDRTYLLEHMIELNIWHYFILMKNMIEILGELDMLYIKKQYFRCLFS